MIIYCSIIDYGYKIDYFYGRNLIYVDIVNCLTRCSY